MIHAAYAFSPVAIPPALTALVVMYLAFRLLGKHLSGAGLAMSVMSVIAAAWQLSFMMMYLSVEPATALRWARTGYGFVPFLAPATYHFAVKLLHLADRRKTVLWLGWLIAAQFAALALTTSYLVGGVRRYWWGFYPIYDVVASIPYMLFFAGFLAAAMVEIARSYPHLRGTERARTRLFAIALAIGYAAAIDYLPVYGVSIYPLGFVALLAYSGMTVYTVLRHGLVPITPSLAANEIISTMQDVLFVSDRDGRIQFANAAAYSLLGYGREDIIGRSLDDLIVPTDETSSLRGRSVRDREYVFRSKTGEEIELTLSYSPVRHETETSGAVVIGRDLRERKRFERESRRALTLLQSTLDSTADGILVIGSEGKLLTWNQRFTELWRIPPELMEESGDGVLIGHLVEQLADPAEFLRSLEALRAHPEVESFHVLEFKDGRRFEQYSIGRTVDKSALRIWSFRDVTARLAAEEALRESEVRYRLLFEQNAAGVCLATVTGNIVDCNSTFADMLGYLPEELRNTNIAELFERTSVSRGILHSLGQNPTLKGLEVELRSKTGAPVWVLHNVSLVGRGEHALLHLTAVDISDRKRAEEQIEFHAYHDALTQLPNRRLFADRLELSLLAAKRARRNAAILFIDLDRFKNLNDTLGHSVADSLLLETAERLRACVRRTDTVARFGGDEFTILLPDLHNPEAASPIAEKILRTLVQPISVGAMAIELSASIGIAVYPFDGEDFDTLLRNADNAMYRAKEAGRNTYQHCTEQMKNRAMERLSLQARLHSAIINEQMFLLYQPLLAVDTGELIGAEALVRWNDPERGVIEPEAFIPIAEDTRLILPLGEWVLYTACRQLRQWRDEGLPPLRLSVNLSARQFQQRDLVDLVQRVVADCRIDAAWLELEITETTAMTDSETTSEMLRSLRQTGISIAIDDFGSGYSSLSYLQQLPVDAVKIDRRFIAGVHRSAGDAAIVSAVINVARTLNLRVIAEGVETQEQFDYLRSTGCLEAQGFYFSVPVRPEEFSATVRELSLRLRPKAAVVA